MKPINNWENVKAAGSYETLPAGGYICKIFSVREVANRNSAGTHLEISFDIAEGEYKDFFVRDYRAQTSEDKYWHGTINQNIPLETSEKYAQQCSFFRAFTDALEASNPGYHWNWDETTLKDKMCGIVFGERERQSQRGTIYTTTYADRVVSVDDIKSGRYKVPELKKLSAERTASFKAETNSDDDLPWA